MYGFQNLSSLCDNLGQVAKQKELSGKQQDLQQLPACLANLSLHYGEADETTLEQ
jgi:hypothetical protein